MQITYNILNLPQSVTQSGTTKATYGWFADGTKYSVLDAQGNGYYYIGSLIYSSTAGTTALESTDFSGGRIVMNGSAQTIHYHHKDHLGSIRAVTDTNGTVIEQNAYYPFGGRHTFGQTYAQTTSNRYKFNGKELQTIGNLGLLDYGARMYDTKIARWLVQDPLAEKYYPFSPYNYCVNNPVMYVDTDGKAIHIVGGAFIGGALNGALALLNGDSPKKILSATLVGAAEGAITASGVGIFSGILIGATGELTEQALNIAIGEQEKLDVVSIGISSISGGASAGLDKVFKKISSFIELNYKSSSIKKSIRDEVISENRKKGEVMGKSTKKDVNNEVKKRIIDYQEGDQFFVEKIKQILNVQVEVIEENIYEDQ